MKIEVIGCSGAEFPGHNSPGFLLDEEILFDAGSLTGVLEENSQMKIRNIFITHAHLDHIRSLPFLADNIIVGKKKHSITVFSISTVIKTIKRHLFNSAVWPDFTIIPDPDNAIINFKSLRAGSTIEINGYCVTAYKVNHTVPAVGYLVENTVGKSFFYTGDTGPSVNTWEKIGNRRIQCLIIDVSFPNSMNEMAIRTGHLTPELLKKELSKMKKLPDQVCITHPKPQYFKTIRSQIKNLKLNSLRILQDGDTIIL